VHNIKMDGCSQRNPCVSILIGFDPNKIVVQLDTLGIDDPNAADKSKAIRNRLEEVLSAGSVPESLSVVYAHVARQLLVDLADVIEEVATSVAANREEARALQGHDNGVHSMPPEVQGLR
jgi:hypothetical protein